MNDRKRYAKQLGKRLEEVRLEKGYSRRVAAEVLEMTERNLYRIEKGKQEIKFMDLVILATLYRTTINKLEQGIE